MKPKTHDDVSNALYVEKIRAEISHMFAEQKRWIVEQDKMRADAEHKRMLTRNESTKTLAAIFVALAATLTALAAVFFRQ